MNSTERKLGAILAQILGWVGIARAVGLPTGFGFQFSKWLCRCGFIHRPHSDLRPYVRYSFRLRGRDLWASPPGTDSYASVSYTHLRAHET